MAARRATAIVPAARAAAEVESRLSDLDASVGQTCAAIRVSFQNRAVLESGENGKELNTRDVTDKLEHGWRKLVSMKVLIKQLNPEAGGTLAWQRRHKHFARLLDELATELKDGLDVTFDNGSRDTSMHMNEGDSSLPTSSFSAPSRIVAPAPTPEPTPTHDDSRNDVLFDADAPRRAHDAAEAIPVPAHRRPDTSNAGVSGPWPSTKETTKPTANIPSIRPYRPDIRSHVAEESAKKHDIRPHQAHTVSYADESRPYRPEMAPSRDAAMNHVLGDSQGKPSDARIRPSGQGTPQYQATGGVSASGNNPQPTMARSTHTPELTRHIPPSYAFQDQNEHTNFDANTSSHSSSGGWQVFPAKLDAGHAAPGGQNGRGNVVGAHGLRDSTNKPNTPASHNRIPITPAAHQMGANGTPLARDDRFTSGSSVPTQKAAGLSEDEVRRLFLELAVAQRAIDSHGSAAPQQTSAANQMSSDARGVTPARVADEYGALPLPRPHVYAGANSMTTRTGTDQHNRNRDDNLHNNNSYRSSDGNSDRWSATLAHVRVPMVRQQQHDAYTNNAYTQQLDAYTQKNNAYAQQNNAYAQQQQQQQQQWEVYATPAVTRDRHALNASALQNKTYALSSSSSSSSSAPQDKYATWSTPNAHTLFRGGTPNARTSLHEGTPNMRAPSLQEGTPIRNIPIINRTPVRVISETQIQDAWRRHSANFSVNLAPKLDTGGELEDVWLREAVKEMGIGLDKEREMTRHARVAKEGVEARIKAMVDDKEERQKKTEARLERRIKQLQADVSATEERVRDEEQCTRDVRSAQIEYTWQHVSRGVVAMHVMQRSASVKRERNGVSGGDAHGQHRVVERRTFGRKARHDGVPLAAVEVAWLQSEVKSMRRLLLHTLDAFHSPPPPPSTHNTDTQTSPPPSPPKPPPIPPPTPFEIIQRMKEHDQQLREALTHASQGNLSPPPLGPPPPLQLECKIPGGFAVKRHNDWLGDVWERERILAAMLLRAVHVHSRRIARLMQRRSALSGTRSSRRDKNRAVGRRLDMGDGKLLSVGDGKEFDVRNGDVRGIFDNMSELQHVLQTRHGIPKGMPLRSQGDDVSAYKDTQNTHEDDDDDAHDARASDARAGQRIPSVNIMSALDAHLQAPSMLLSINKSTPSLSINKSASPSLFAKRTSTPALLSASSTSPAASSPSTFSNISLTHSTFSNISDSITAHAQVRRHDNIISHAHALAHIQNDAHISQHSPEPHTSRAHFAERLSGADKDRELRWLREQLHELKQALPVASPKQRTRAVRGTPSNDTLRTLDGTDSLLQRLNSHLVSMTSSAHNSTADGSTGGASTPPSVPVARERARVRVTPNSAGTLLFDQSPVKEGMRAVKGTPWSFV